MSENIRVIGIGSPFGADRFGWLVMEHLQQNHALQSFLDDHIEFVSADRPGLNLLHLIQGKAHVILIDTLTDCPEPGRIHRLDKTQLLQQEVVISSHAVGVAEALALGEKLGHVPDRLVLFGLCVSPKVAEIEFEWIKSMEMVILHELDI